MKKNKMVIAKLIPLGFKVGKQLFNADYAVFRKAGWKPYAARGISHGITTGTAISNIYHGGDGIDDGEVSGKYSSSAKNQARSGRFRNYNRRNNNFQQSGKRIRRSCNCKYRRSKNRFNRQRYIS